MNPKLLAKLALRRVLLLRSFCKRCGRTVCDFQVSDEDWERVQPLIKHGNTLCYDCYCDLTGHVYRLGAAL